MFFNLVFIAGLVSIIFGFAYWSISRYRLVRYLGKNHPLLWTKLDLSNSMDEVSGFSPKLARWVSCKEYITIGDIELSARASKYQNAKLLAFPCVFFGLMAIVFLIN